MIEIKRHGNLLAFRYLEAPKSGRKKVGDLELTARKVFDAFADFGIELCYGKYSNTSGSYIRFACRCLKTQQEWRFGAMRSKKEQIAHRALGRMFSSAKNDALLACGRWVDWYVMDAGGQISLLPMPKDSDCPRLQFARFFCQSVELSISYVGTRGLLKINALLSKEDQQLFQSMSQGVQPDFEEIGKVLADAAAIEIHKALQLGIFDSMQLCLDATLLRGRPSIFELDASFAEWLPSKLAALSKSLILGDQSE